MHRLGLDKPLGLGQVAVRVRGVFLVDRCERYSQTGLFAPRYHRWWGESELQEDPAIQAHYPTEAAAAAAQADPREWPQGLIDPEALSILRTLGDPRATVEHPVCYPFSDAHGQTAFHETEGFHWFVENEQGRQYLPKITPETEALSTLDSKRPAPQDPPRHTPSGSHKDSERQLYVTGITADMSEQVLGEVLTVEFSRVLGCRIDVQRVALPRDRSTGIPRGFGFVTLDSPQSVKRVLQHLEGQRLQVTGGSIRIRRYNPH